MASLSQTVLGNHKYGVELSISASTRSGDVSNAAELVKLLEAIAELMDTPWI